MRRKRNYRHCRYFLFIVGIVGIVGIFFNVGISYAQDLSFDNTCAICHFKEAEDYNNSVHQKAKVDCVGCHGGDPKILDKDGSMDPAKGYIGEPKPAEVANFCGRCHEEVKGFFEKSPHKSAADRGLMKACIGCHSSHAVVHAELSIYQTTCIRCHGPASEEVEHGQKIIALIGEVSTNATKASDLLAEAQNNKFKTNPTKVEAFRRDVIQKISTLQHELSIIAMNKNLKASQALIETIQLDTNRAISSLKWRKYGLAIAWVAILLNMTVLYLKKREVDRR
jgi:hypothetical protein